MEDVEEWSAKDDIFILANVYKIGETAIYPKMQGDKITKITKRPCIKIPNEKNVDWKFLKKQRPKFSIFISSEEEIIVSDHYERELECILNLDDKDKIIEALSNLDFWIINFIFSFPKNRSKEHFDVWKNKEINKINNGCSLFCPNEYQKLVKEKNKMLVNEKWKKEMIKNVNKVSTKFICFQTITLAKIPSKKNKNEQPIANIKKYRT